MSRSGPTAYDVALYEELLSEGVVKKLGNVHGPFSATLGSTDGDGEDSSAPSPSGAGRQVPH